MISYLGEDGLVLGNYELFDALDNNLGTRAFYFTIEGRLHDLGTLVEGGLLANGWKSLHIAWPEISLGRIVGNGSLLDPAGSVLVYLLTPNVGIPGDFNNDQIVNLADYTVWRDNLGGSESTLSGNGSGNGIVGPEDYDLWKLYFGQLSPQSALQETVVPEPATPFLLVLTGVPFAFCRRLSSPRFNATQDLLSLG